MKLFSALLLTVGYAGAAPDCSYVPDFSASDIAPFLNGTITTPTNKLAQAYFQAGIMHQWGFNQVEAANMFACCVEADPTAAMCHFGIAYAAGPFLNKPHSTEQEISLASSSVLKAQSLAIAHPVTVDEQLLIDSFQRRFVGASTSAQTLGALAYRDYLKEACTPFSSCSTDVLALYAESEMDTMCSQGLSYYQDSLQTSHGAPNPSSVAAMSAMESILTTQPSHVLALHLYIHITEPLTPGGDAAKGEAAADGLARLNLTESGHFEHMPSHLYLRVGRYDDVVNNNVLAHKADDLYYLYNHLPYGPAHNTYFLTVGAALDGQASTAIEYAHIMRDIYRPEGDEDDSPAEEMGWNALLQYYVRFGMWQDVINDVEWNARKYPFSLFLGHYCRGIAYAKLGELDLGEQEYQQMLALIDEVDSSFTSRVTVAKNTIEALLAETNEEAIKKMVLAAEEQNSWGYNSPPLWSQPSNECLGALYLKCEMWEAAEEAFGSDLVEYPENYSGLMGMVESLVGSGADADTIAAWQQRADIAGARATIEYSSACMIFK